ncbi:hypothetical protein BJX64DRAFT_299316 [Aspergillus heterothallicus]
MEIPTDPLRLRTRTGCFTCNLHVERRVKCDEARPHCVRCTSTGRKCDGYASSPSSQLSTRHHGGNLIRQTPPLIRSPGSSHGNVQESRAFQYFYERTVPSLSGYYGSEFWNRFVLQVSQHEKSVWHALIALGSLHENFENDRRVPGLWFSRKGHDDFAVREYVLAIRALLGARRLNGTGTQGNEESLARVKLTVDVYLISCILFTCFEILSSHYDSAINHVRAGIKIISETHYDRASGAFCHPHLSPSTVTALEMDTLRKMLIQLQDQVLTLVSYSLHNSSSDGPTADIPIPNEFHSVAEARDVFEYYQTKAARQFHNAAPAFISRDRDPRGPTDTETTYPVLIEAYSTILSKFHNMLDRLSQRSNPPLSAREQIGIKIIHIHAIMQRIRLEHAKLGVFADQLSWDRFSHLFDQIVTLAADVVDSTQGFQCLSLSPSELAALSSQGALKPSFTMDKGIVGPLFNVATLCRDPIIRRRATHVLRSASRQEGCFNSHISAVVAEQAIAIEEGVAVALRTPSGFGTEAAASPLLPGALTPWNNCMFGQITESSEVPEEARLMLVYPRVSSAKKTMYIRLCHKGVEVDTPLPGISLIVDGIP